MNYINVSEEDLKKWLKSHLNEERYIHSLATAQCAKELAQKFSQDCEKAYMAGLLHDCAKCFTNEELKEIIDKHLEIEDSEKISFKTWHAPVSAYVAQAQFGVTDEEILSSIRWHTVGKLGMTDFEKIIYIADKIEPQTREKELREPIARYLDEPDGLNKAMLASFKGTIKSLVARDLKICYQTIEIYNYLEDSINVN